MLPCLHNRQRMPERSHLSPRAGGLHLGQNRWAVPPCLDFPRETGLILRFAGKSGNPFQMSPLLTPHSPVVWQPHLMALQLAAPLPFCFIFLSRWAFCNCSARASRQRLLSVAEHGLSALGLQSLLHVGPVVGGSVALEQGKVRKNPQGLHTARQGA